ncbi:hypothetical protein FPZ43_02735 [Mucilaginibacter pallidiroseus]|uniref:Uncharacterized protein n=1 Tax=Mucilaginibacter pallidiroseus TaxID=2599295 RepID=A0A563UJ91_9SPHI|nr:hypothetical protein [Mucilaginibacter pallidiroseus]TWR31411.1 hypothetical protein FPZ43_02735 [Mucilaginibacter pallidiroseus]
MKVLITAATSAAAHKLKNSLGNAEILLGDFADLPAFMRNNIIKLPDPASDTYAHQMLTLSLDNEIERLYAMLPAEAGTLLKSQQLFSEYNIEIVDGSANL